MCSSFYCNAIPYSDTLGSRRRYCEIPDVLHRAHRPLLCHKLCVPVCCSISTMLFKCSLCSNKAFPFVSFLHSIHYFKYLHVLNLNFTSSVINFIQSLESASVHINEKIPFETCLKYYVNFSL